jgi:CRISPR-associated protein Csx10
MTEVEITLCTRSPLALRASRAGLQFAPGLCYIPGTTLRGALAAQYLLTGQPDNSSFAALFLEERVFFPDLYPVPLDAQGQPHPETAKPLPATARACKRHAAGHPGSLTDSLLRLELATVLGQGAPLREQDWKTCPACGNDRDRLSGAYVGLDHFRKVDAHLRLITGTSINRATSTVEETQLFSFDVLEERQLFRGRLRFQPETAESLLTQLRKLVPDEVSLRLGKGRSRGLGRVEVAGWREPRQAQRHLEARWTQLNKAAQRLWQHFEAGRPKGEYFSLTLESGLIRRDRLLRPQSGIPTAAELGLPGEVEPRRCALNTFTVQGWNAALGLPKADTPALGPGTVLLYRLMDPTQKETVLARLKEIEREGVGERRAEGFGRVQACDPFHYYWTLQEVEE